MDILSTLPAWASMWLLAVAIYVVCKFASWSVRTERAPAWRHVAYLAAWPGMDSDAFLRGDRASAAPADTVEWLVAASKLAAGVVVVWGLVPLVRANGDFVAGWTAMIGIALILHFGAFHLLSCAWRRAGLAARPIMNRPLLSESVTDFWSRRWNLAFRDLAHRFVFVPLRRPWGASAATVAAFVVSGLVHDVVISAPSGGGWGLPTLYFVVQGLAVLLERSPLGRDWGLGRGTTGRLFGVAMVLLPSPLVFHVPFVMRIVLPFLAAIGAVA